MEYYKIQCIVNGPIHKSYSMSIICISVCDANSPEMVHVSHAYFMRSPRDSTSVASTQAPHTSTLHRIHNTIVHNAEEYPRWHARVHIFKIHCFHLFFPVDGWRRPNHGNVYLNLQHDVDDDGFFFKKCQARRTEKKLLCDIQRFASPFKYNIQTILGHRERESPQRLPHTVHTCSHTRRRAENDARVTFSIHFYTF